MEGYKVGKQLYEFFCPEQAEDVWAPERDQFIAVGADFLGCHNGTVMYLGPFQGRHLCGSLYHLPVVYLLFRLKPGAPPQAPAANIFACRLSPGNCPP